MLGEFSSGKSSLINAMLGRTVLPAMEHPSTANVVEIHPEAERTTFTYSRIVERDGKAVEVALLPSDLSECCVDRVFSEHRTCLVGLRDEAANPTYT